MFHLDLADFLRKEGYDVLRTGQTGHDRADDSDILKYATNEGRILVTLDEHYGDWAVLPLQKHCGVIRVKIHPILTQNIAKILLPFLAEHTQDEFRDRLVILSPHKVRWITTGAE